VKKNHLIKLTLSACLLLTGCGLRSSQPREKTSNQTKRRCDAETDSARRLREARDKRQTAYSSADPQLDRLQDFFRPTLESNQKSFDGRSGPVRGFGAGAVYPQVWLRDSATIIPASRFYYPAEYLTSWLEEHLSHQQEDGGLFDWIAPASASNFLPVAPRARDVFTAGFNAARVPTEGPQLTISADKNTTEADQETSAVIAAAQVFAITRDQAWLRKNLDGRTLLQRLDSALEYLLRRKFNPTYGLLTNSFTADWGDLSPTYPDQRSIYADERTPAVVGLYTNAQFYRAAEGLSGLYHAVGNQSRADYWRTRAVAVKDNINRHLWQDERGFYRLHLNVAPERVAGLPDDAHIYATGGNALAALYRIADDSQAARIFEVARARQHEFGLSTVSGTLLPPYPSSFFRYPLMSEEYSYQNGGQWDWLGGRLLLAEFERGHAADAFRQLVEIAAKSVANHGLHEWHTRDGRGQGSPNYAGNVGALGGALFEGLFGVYLSREQLDLRIRLGARSGALYLYEPATDNYVAYDYCHDAETRTVRLIYESDVAAPGRLSLLVPEGRRVAELRLDGEQREFEEELVGRDRYVSVGTDWRRHRLELMLSAAAPDAGSP
jgi:hypothetical protein